MIYALLSYWVTTVTEPQSARCDLGESAHLVLILTLSITLSGEISYASVRSEKRTEACILTR